MRLMSTGVNPMTTKPFINEISCDEEVYKKGSVFETLDIPKEKANEYCMKLSMEDPSYKYDWHYFGGRVIVKRLEREILRNEKKQKQLTLNDNEVMILVSYACVELGAITIKNMKADTAHFYSLRHLYTDLLVQHRDEILFKEIGNYELKGKLEINQHGVEIWNFELIDFKPLDK